MHDVGRAQMILTSILLADEGAANQPLPPKVVENIESFKQHHPVLEHRLFRTEETRAFVAAEYGGEVLAAYDTLKPYAYKSDLARLCILLKHGGLYADLSVYFLRSWRQEDNQLGIFRDFFFAAPWQTANTVFFAPPGHKALAKGIELICENVRKRRYGKTFLCPTGPICFGRALAMTCDSEEYVSGDSAWCREVPDHPGLIAQSGAHGFVIGSQIVAVMRKRGGAPPSEIGITGGNAYTEMWYQRDIYNAP